MSEDRIFVVKGLRVPSAAAPHRSWYRRLLDRPGIRRALVTIALALVWQGYAKWLDNNLLVPTTAQTIEALVDGFARGHLFARLWNSLLTLLAGYGLGIAVGALLTALALSSQLGREVQGTLVAMFNPLPAIALLPLAMLWFGIGTASLLFVLAHAVAWTFSLNVLAGFDAVSPTLRMVGRNYGLRNLRYVWYILIPAAFPSLLTGLRTSWAFAWRTLIAAELVFGVSSGSGGLGWYIYENKNQLEIPAVFAGLLTVIGIGLIIENGVFAVVEQRTLRRWRL